MKNRSEDFDKYLNSCDKTKEKEYFDMDIGKMSDVTVRLIY